MTVAAVGVGGGSLRRGVNLLKSVFFIAIIKNTAGPVSDMNEKFRKIWKGFWEPVLGCVPVQWVIVTFFWLSTWLVYLTSRKEFIRWEIFEEYRNRPAIFAFWHGRTMMLSPVVCLGGTRSFAVASRHKDGRMMARLQRMFGMGAIYGSTSDGAVPVLRQALSVLQDGAAICISPDGPGGPSLRLHDGALYMAKMSGAPIIPVCFSASRAWFQKRWDRYLVALPFSKITVRLDKPIFIPRDCRAGEFEKMRQHVEDVMLRQMRELDAQYGLFEPEQDLKTAQFKREMRAQRTAKKHARQEQKGRKK